MPGFIVCVQSFIIIQPICLSIHLDTVIFMKSSVTIRRELTVLKIEEGIFDFRHGEACNSAVADLLAREESKNLIIDFSDVKAIDPTVIASIRFAQECANKCGGFSYFRRPLQANQGVAETSGTGQAASSVFIRL